MKRFAYYKGYIFKVFKILKNILLPLYPGIAIIISPASQNNQWNRILIGIEYGILTQKPHLGAPRRVTRMRFARFAIFPIFPIFPIFASKFPILYLTYSNF
jgi:hypothetical protein